MGKMLFSLTARQEQALREAAAQEGVPISEIVRRAIARELSLPREQVRHGHGAPKLIRKPAVSQSA